MVFELTVIGGARRSLVQKEQIVGKKKKVYTTTVETLLFSFSRSKALWCIPFFPDLRCIPFALVFPGEWYTPWLFLLCDLGVGRQTEKRGVRRWRCILFFFPWKEASRDVGDSCFSPGPPRHLMIFSTREFGRENLSTLNYIT